MTQARLDVDAVAELFPEVENVLDSSRKATGNERAERYVSPFHVTHCLSE